MKMPLRAYQKMARTALANGRQNVGMKASQPQGHPLFTPQDILKSLWNRLASLLMFRLRLVPLVIFFAVLVLGARVTTLFSHIGEKDLFQRAHAAPTEKKQQKPLSKLDEIPSKNKAGLKALDEFDPFNMTADQYRALKGVVSQRDQLSDRERSISEKEQVLQALIEKMDTKVAELNKAKTELQNLIGKIDEEENANTKRLVKMTEAMKPPKAAKVLEGIEFPILLEIMETMKEKKASAILASMDAEKAGYLMTAMSKRRKVFKKGNPQKAIMEG